MPNPEPGKRSRVPWNTRTREWRYVTVPIYMAYCAVAAALRPWNGIERKFIATLVFKDDYYQPIYSQAAQVFAREIWKGSDWETYIFEWSNSPFRHQSLAEKNGRGIFLSPPGYRLTDDERLFSDAVIEIEPRSPEHARAALRRAAIPVDDELVELLISAPWARLHSAFQDRRGPVQGLERLRRETARLKEVESAKILRDDGPTLDDMHGLGPAVEWGRNLAKDLADYKSGLIGWNEVDGGVLLSGPPGIGKTLFATALANSCKVPIIYGSVSKWQEAGALDAHLKAMRASFKQARDNAPSVLFIDEFDTLGKRTASGQNAGYHNGVLAGALELFDGFERREGVVVVAACNQPHLVDVALLRAGRLDRHLELTLPDGPSRRGILKFHTGIELSTADAEMFEFATEGFSGAEIERLVRDARRTARRQADYFSAVHIIDQLPAIEKLPEEYLRVIAFHEAGHALVSYEIGHEVSGITISKWRVSGESRVLGSVDSKPSLVQARTKTTYLDTIAIYLGGIAAEVEVFGSFADGASGSSEADLNRATDLATMVEGTTGMGHTLAVEATGPGEFARMRLYNPELREQVHVLLDSELARTRSIIQRQRPALDALVDRLMANPTMTGQDVVQVLQSNRRSVVSLAKTQLRTGT
ncbi:AAA family ATPase [Rhizobium phaseoli]|uniref:AAA family ATPase n=1 Tax=Rhizobium phaseoli TaxID=396 RepID=UPI0007EBAD19|nr:AAA family ATPase [Rhizobium phaseoli]ANL42423.1 ATP-dependent peptidase M41 family protein [Rhizobium phaseoli]ANL61409.1 ATP-dependent peptidase M41 family protein [Rhizobium phaseoli]